MSGLGAIFSLDGGPVDRSMASRLRRRLERRSSGATSEWRADGVALIATRAGSGASPAAEEAVAIATARYRIVADARLDNRDDLIPQLGDRLCSAVPPRDDEVILAAYDRWGDECAHHLIGDFAFVIWDGSRRRLFCARDVMGVRPLTYAVAGGTLVVASTVGGVLAALGTEPPINRSLVSDLLRGRLARWVRETAFEQIMRVPGGCSLRADRAGIEIVRDVRLGEATGDRLADEREYVERFRDLLERAVRDRLRDEAPAAVLTSGGIDSSSIACLVDRMQGRGEARLYSCVFDETPAANERAYLDAVVAACGHMPATLVPSDDCWGLREFGPEAGYPLDEPELGIDRVLMLKPLRKAREDGCRVVISGYWADQVLSADAYDNPNVVRDVPMRRLAFELPYFARRTTPAGWWRLPYGLLRPIVPKSVRRALSGRAIVEKPDALASQVGFRTECATIVHQQLTDGLFAARAVMHDAIAEQSEIEWRFPFLDRRLVEFMLHVPRGTPFRAGVTKFVLRESMTGILPETIRQRTSVALFSELADRGVREKERARIERLLHCPDVVRLGFAPPDRVMRLVDACRQDGRPADRRALVAMLCVESWLRHRAQAAGAVSRRTPRPEAVGQ